MAVLLWAVIPLQAAKDIRIVIYHTNDIHGWIMARPPKGHLRDSKKLVGGMAALASYIHKAKGAKLLLDAGDWFQGTPEGSLSQGRAMVDSFNALHYDAVEVGNHDFDLGEAQLQKLVQALKIPVLGANVYSKKTGKRVPYLKPFIIEKINGVNIGIFGLLTTNMPHLAFPEHIAGLRFRREINEARQEVRALQKRGATVIIALTHVGIRMPGDAPFEDDRFIAAHVPGIDVIVGGHSHTLLPKGYRDPVHGTLIVQAGSYLTHVGKVVLDIDEKTKRVKKSKASVIKLNINKTGLDPELAGIVARYRDEVNQKMSVVLGTAPIALTRNSEAESALGDWMADCLRSWAKTDTAFQNSGGIRSDLAAGPVTLRDIFDIMPFDNYVTTMSLTGNQVREILEHGVSGNQGILQVSGLSFRYNPRAPEGKRVLDVAIAGSPIVSTAAYSAATLNFLASGGDGYLSFSHARGLQVTHTLVRDVLSLCAEKTPPQSPKSGRIQLSAARQ